jgi:hypothetical protein
MRTTIIISVAAAAATVFAATAYIWYEDNKKRSLLKTVFIESISTPEIESPPEQTLSREDSQTTMISGVSTETEVSTDQSNDERNDDQYDEEHVNLEYNKHIQIAGSNSVSADDELSDDDNDENASQEEPEIEMEYGPVLELILHYFSLVIMLNLYVYICLLK